MATVPLKRKVRAPVRRAEHLERLRIVERITATGAGRWTLISAPPGYGKSVIASQAAAASAVPVAWLLLDAMDDVPRFATHVIAALQTVDETIGDETRLALDRNFAEPDIALAILNDVASIETPCLLILDGLSAADAQVEQIVLDLAGNLPSALQLAIATRTDPATSLHRARADGTVVTLRADDLAFSAPEVAQVFDRRSLSLRPTQIDAVLAATKGWPIAVNLIAASVAGGAALDRTLERISGHADLLAVLAGDVLDTFDPPLRRAAIALGPLMELTGPLVEHLLPGVSGDAVLAEMYRRNAFIEPTDETRALFEVHPVWTQFLTDRGVRELGSAHTSETLLRAADWYERADDLSRAVDLALRAKDVGRVAALAERACFRHLNEGDGAPVLRWTSALSEARTPTLEIARAWALLLAFKWRDADDLARSISERLDPRTDVTALGHANAVRAVVAFAARDTVQGEAFAAKAIAALGPSDPTSGAVRGDRGIARAAAGNIPAAREDLGEVARMGRNAIARGAAWHLAELDFTEYGAARARAAHLGAVERDDHPLHPSRAALAELARESGAFERAREILGPYLTEARREGSAYAVAIGLIGHARIAMSDGRFDAAREHLAEAAELTDRPGLPAASAPVRALQALSALRAYVASADAAALDEAQAAAASLPPDQDAVFPIAPNLPPELVTLTRARIELARKAPGPAVARLDTLRARAQEQGRHRSVIELELVGTLAGDDAALAQAAERAEAFGMSRLAAEDRALRTFLRGQPSAPPTRERSPGRLSRRELEVLELVATGLTTSAVARKLFVSHATVKKHLENIYGRLDVRGRMQAVARARALTLLQ